MEIEDSERGKKKIDIWKYLRIQAGQRQHNHQNKKPKKKKKHDIKGRDRRKINYKKGKETGSLCSEEEKVQY